MKRSTLLWLALPLLVVAGLFGVSRTAPPPVPEREGSPAGGKVVKSLLA